MKHMDCKYTRFLLLTFILAASFIYIPVIILWHSGEMWGAHKQVQYQLKNEALLSYGFLDKEKGYKKALYTTINPEITILGSSRVLQFRQNMFAMPFVNMGRGLELHNIETEVEFLLNNPNLRLVLYGIDYWTFGNHFCHEHANYKIKENAVGVNSENVSKFTHIIPREILGLWPMILEERISVTYFLNPFSNPKKKLGLRALYTDQGGYLIDGSYIYLDKFNDPPEMKRIRSNEIKTILDTQSPYQLPQDTQICNKSFSNILFLAQTLKQKGIQFAAFVVPLPQDHAKTLIRLNQGKFYNSVTEGLKELKQEIQIADYLNPAVIKYTDDEFIDSIHPGEIISSRILLDLAQKYPFLEEYLDQSFMNNQIDICKNQAFCGNHNQNPASP